jgi:hypothetical protein
MKELRVEVGKDGQTGDAVLCCCGSRREARAVRCKHAFTSGQEEGAASHRKGITQPIKRI